MRKTTWAWAVWAAVAAGILSFGAFVWPTLYAPIPVTRDVLSIAPNYSVIMGRQNRITGDVQWLVAPIGWVDAPNNRR